MSVTRQTLNKNARVVLETVQATNHHPNALEIYEAVRHVQPRIGLATVYRCLHHLTALGLITEVECGQQYSRYDGRTGRHDHAICINCGALLDLPMDVTVSQEAVQKAAQSVGIEVVSHEVRLYGYCRSCSPA